MYLHEYMRFQDNDLKWNCRAVNDERHKIKAIIAEFNHNILAYMMWCWRDDMSFSFTMKMSYAIDMYLPILGNNQEVGFQRKKQSNWSIG